MYKFNKVNKISRERNHMYFKNDHFKKGNLYSYSYVVKKWGKSKETKGAGGTINSPTSPPKSSPAWTKRSKILLILISITFRKKYKTNSSKSPTFFERQFSSIPKPKRKSVLLLRYAKVKWGKEVYRQFTVKTRLWICLRDRMVWKTTWWVRQ